MQFTMETSDIQLPFLDALINKDEINFFEYLFKKTGSKRCVSFKLNHSKHCLKSIPFTPIHWKDSLKEIKLKEPETLQTLLTN